MASDAKSKAMLQKLMNDYKAQQDAINQMIKDKTQNDINDRFDEENDLLDDQIEQSKDKFESILEQLDNNLTEFLKPENINKLIQDGMVSGFVTMGDEVINVKDSMMDFINESTIGFTNITLEINDFIDSLKEVQGLYGNINNIMSGANISNLNTNRNMSRNSSPINIDLGGITINGEVGRDTLSEIERMMKNQEDRIYKNIYNQLK